MIVAHMVFALKRTTYRQLARYQYVRRLANYLHINDEGID